MDYSKEFKEYSIKHHGINSLYYDKLVSSMTNITELTHFIMIS